MVAVDSDFYAINLHNYIKSIVLHHHFQILKKLILSFKFMEKKTIQPLKMDLKLIDKVVIITGMLFILLKFVNLITFCIDHVTFL